MPRSARTSAAAPTLAKFSRPRLYNVQKRDRLYRLLDDHRAHPIVWIAGPPGSGKTTLVASYIEARKLPGIWFQADPGDGDPGTFFHYLRVAAADLAGRRPRAVAALPMFSPEYANQLPAFTRRFLREFFALFPPGSVLVVDNFHEPKGDTAWRFAFAEGLREIPEGMNIIILSREPPVAEMARLVGEQRITRIGWETLRFTAEESAAMTATAHLDPALAQAIHRATDGWAAGIVLMREHLNGASTAASAATLPEGKEAVFDYFTGEIFGRARPENQRILLLTALLPSVSASDAEAVSGNTEAPLVLDYLYRRHLFTDRRRTGGEPVYQFHALFREFLMAEGRRRLTNDERRDAQTRAGGQMVARGDFDAAAALYIDAQAWTELAGLTMHAGRLLLDEGREHTLGAWLAALPQSARDAEPRLQLAEAYACLHADPNHAKVMLARARAGFAARGDVRRELLTAAAAVECHYFEWADFAPLDGWIATFERLLDPGPGDLATTDALRIRSALLIALLFRQPEHPRIAATAAEVEALLGAADIDTVPVNERINAASILFNYFNWKAKDGNVDGLIHRVEPWLAAPQTTPPTRVWWHVHRAFHEQIRGHYARSRKIMEEIEDYAAEHGLDWARVEIHHATVTALVSSGDVAGAAAAFDKLRAVVSPSRKMDVAYMHYQEAGVRLLQQRPREAANAAALAIAVGRESGLPPVQVPHFLVRQATCHLYLDEYAVALALYDEAIALAVDVDRTSFAHHADFVRAYIHAASGDTHAALARLRDLLAAGRSDRYMGFMRIPPPLLATMLALALQHGIETDYVRALIRRHRLAPPDLSTPDWPWPLAIQTLGEFALLRDGVPLVSKGKAQKKPLELLKALVAHGGRGVDATMLTTLLWPEAEGDDAKTSFDSNLYRLRKLLDVDGALVLTEGKLSLDASRVAVDTWSLEAALDAGDVTTALRLYRGPFLALDAAPAFALPARDRWQARLVREVLAAGDKLERAGDWPAARAIYERTLEVDNLAEAVYRRLMICQREAGDAAGALVTYRRCRELLSIVLGRVPAPETEAVRQTL